MKFLRSLLNRYLAWKPAVALQTVGCFLSPYTRRKTKTMKVLPTFFASPVTTFYYLIILYNVFTVVAVMFFSLLNPWLCNGFLPLKFEIALPPAKNGFAEWP